MADRTDSSIDIAATPGEVLDVIADVQSSPEWATEVKAVTVLTEEGDGWADQVEFTLDAGAIKVVFLEGQGEAPVLESEQGFEVDGMRWRARLDVKAQMFDPKGAVTNAGA